MTLVSQELLTHRRNELKVSARDDWETWHEPGVINTESRGKSVWSPGAQWNQYLQILDLHTFLSGIVVFRSHFAVKHTHTTAVAKLMMCNCVYCPQNLFFYLNIISNHKEQLFTVSTPTTLVAIFKAQWGIILGGLGFSNHQYVRSFSFSANTPWSIPAIKSSFLCRGLKGLAFKLQLTNSWSLTAKLRKICNGEKSQRGGFEVRWT